MFISFNVVQSIPLSSIYVVTKSSLRVCDGVLLEVALIGSYVTGSEVTLVTWPEEALPGTGSDGVRMRNGYILYYYHSNSTKCSTSTMATGNDRRSRDPEGVLWAGVRMRNRKLYNICPSGAFSPEVTSSKVTPKGFPWKGAHMRNRKLRNIRSNVWEGGMRACAIECAQ